MASRGRRSNAPEAEAGARPVPLSHASTLAPTDRPTSHLGNHAGLSDRPTAYLGHHAGLSDRPTPHLGHHAGLSDCHTSHLGHHAGLSDHHTSHLGHHTGPVRPSHASPRSPRWPRPLALTPRKLAVIPEDFTGTGSKDYVFWVIFILFKTFS